MYIRQFEQFHSTYMSQIIGGGIHPFHELLFISSGKVTIDWIEHSYTVNGPALFIFPPHSPHRIRQMSSVLQCWFIEMRLLQSNYAPNAASIVLWNQAQASLDWNEPRLAPIRNVMQAIESMLPSNGIRNARVPFQQLLACDIQKLLLLIDQYIHVYQAEINGSSTSDPRNDKWSAHQDIYELVRHMEMFFTEDISLDRLAERSGYTQSYVSRLFREITEFSPQQYLNELRMSAATSYLYTTNMSVQKIAEAVGYPGIHYFSRMFKKKFGVSPSEWRQKHTLV
ncbi:AraC family transcriptional regulator [Cohnella herbarum]|uniref:Helix-turn-helix transcriptional regulator n=1 Tax=Cohnella herbarum TaxID=2728023 RepID=A0A7Z2VKS3_9BACL|nr:helix-turn-helix domain-containing protein [Cohnella herbarum]QJD84704.1 helix-turn-helix transcriptional regulator [Cohnella herbarum]